MPEVQHKYFDRNPFADYSIGHIGVTYGMITSAALIVYFMIMKTFHFMTSEIAWGFNFLILLAGIFLAYSHLRSKSKLTIDYIPGLTLGLLTTAASVLPFVIFMYLFILQHDPGQVQQLSNNLFFMGAPVTALRAAGATLIEGCCSGLIITFSLMQYFRSGFRLANNEIRTHG